MIKTQVAIFASGTGSNFDAIMREIEVGKLDCEVCLLVCDQPNAGVIEKASKYHVPTFIFNPSDYRSKIDFEQDIATKLAKSKVEWIILAGYMRLIGPTLLSRYPSKVINIHPSLLPSFPGKDAVGQAIDAGVKVTGVTIHFVDEGMDTGPIIEQEALRIDQEATRDSLQYRIQTIEHRLYPKTIQSLITAGTVQNERGANHEKTSTT